jgi:hypothetical protein
VSLIETARAALKTIPMSDILRERLSLAIDQLAISETKIDVLQRENGKLASRLDQEQLDHNQTKHELQALRDFHAEAIRFIHGIEFKKGIRTENKWLPFCPKCHLPIVITDTQDGHPYCSDPKCGWSSSLQNHKFVNIDNQ